MPTVDELQAALTQAQQQLADSVARCQVLEHEKANAEVNRDAVFRVSAKLPTFWADKPAVWFAQADAQFTLAGIGSSKTKYSYVVSQLDTRVACEVEDIITGPETGHTYEKIRDALTQRLSMSEERRVKQLIQEEEMGDRKPSQFLRHLRSLAGNSQAVSDNLLRQIWLQRLPATASAILTSQSTTMALDDMATLADRIIEVSPAPAPAVLAVQRNASQPANPLEEQLGTLAKQVAALTAKFERRSRSRSRSFSQSHDGKTDKRDDGPCWYHQRYGNDAKRCSSPCNFKAGNARGSQ